MTDISAVHGLTERQTHFLVTVMLHSGVFVGRQYAAFAGITHGQKVHDFTEVLVARKFVTSIELGSTGRTRICHVHHKPLDAVIGEPDNRNRRRVTADRAIERLMVLDGVLADRTMTWLGAAHELLATPLSLSQIEELTWLLRQPQMPEQGTSAVDRARLQAAQEAFRSPRFAAIRRHWLAEGTRAIFLAASPVARDHWSVGERVSIAWTSLSLLLPVGAPAGEGQTEGMKLSG